MLEARGVETIAISTIAGISSALPGSGSRDEVESEPPSTSTESAIPLDDPCVHEEASPSGSQNRRPPHLSVSLAHEAAEPRPDVVADVAHRYRVGIKACVDELGAILSGLEEVFPGRVGAVEEDSEQDVVEEAEGFGRQEQVGQGDAAAWAKYSMRSREEIRPRVEAAFPRRTMGSARDLDWGRTTLVQEDLLVCAVDCKEGILRFGSHRAQLPRGVATSEHDVGGGEIRFEGASSCTRVEF